MAAHQSYLAPISAIYQLNPVGEIIAGYSGGDCDIFTESGKRCWTYDPRKQNCSRFCFDVLDEWLLPIFEDFLNPESVIEIKKYQTGQVKQYTLEQELHSPIRKRLLISSTLFSIRLITEALLGTPTLLLELLLPTSRNPEIDRLSEIRNYLSELDRKVIGADSGYVSPDNTTYRYYFYVIDYVSIYNIYYTIVKPILTIIKNTVERLFIKMQFSYETYLYGGEGWYDFFKRAFNKVTTFSDWVQPEKLYSDVNQTFLIGIPKIFPVSANTNIVPSIQGDTDEIIPFIVQNVLIFNFESLFVV